ncbi:MAG: hypothetical protein BWK76_28655 [Desulfobulbaceae bacterium A2]|nr:MAG: hypothetical protein BWK76_28655 [Desulfobulbaceae bacterium A2]
MPRRIRSVGWRRRFFRRPGCVYHLYCRPDGSRYLSLLAPADWQGCPPHPYLGFWRLENDMSFSRVAGPETARATDGE